MEEYAITMKVRFMTMIILGYRMSQYVVNMEIGTVHNLQEWLPL
jgi:hypothetical protein